MWRIAPHLGEFVVDVEDRATRVAEDGVGAFLEQALQKDARAAHRFGRRLAVQLGGFAASLRRRRFSGAS